MRSMVRRQGDVEEQLQALESCNRHLIEQNKILRHAVSQLDGVQDNVQVSSDSLLGFKINWHM